MVLGRPWTDPRERERGSGARASAGERGGLLLALAPERISETLRVRETMLADWDATARARAILNRVADTVEPGLRFQIDLVLTDLICQRTLDSATAQERTFEIEVSRAPASVRVELVDAGQPEAPARAEELTTPAAELQLVAELADRWGMSVEGTTTIWFEFLLDDDA